mgnify:CR=1 FL=1|jgi:hypothetical protein
MAFKNIFSSAYAIVENVNYNGPRKSLTFDLVLYRDSFKTVETGRMSYQVHGNRETYEIDSVITAVPAGLEMEAFPADFDFDALAKFKQYLIGNNPTAPEFTEAGSGELKTGMLYLCEIGPQKVTDPENPDGPLVWPKSPGNTYAQLENPDYSDGINDGLEEGDEGYVYQYYDGDQIFNDTKIKYDWGAIGRDQFKIFVDKDGDYWEVTGNIGSGNQVVTQLDAPFLDADWQTWFSATAMDKLNKNISERIYTWLKAKPEYKDAVSI